ncbi:MAG: DUF2017 domain-containing protein [Actinomycetia bacterium]|nr:DUF2017 domain-containing protein [Actinomycetes bacterium]
MARAFKVRHVKIGRVKEPRYAARLEAVERDLVAGLAHQVAELIEVPEPQGSTDPSGAEAADPFDDIVAQLGMSISPDASAPGEEGSRAEQPSHVAGVEDPAIRRLFPIANRTDDEAAAEFARLSETGLRRRKRENLLRAAALLGHSDVIELAPPDAHAFLVALTDIRVVLGERIGLRTDDDAAALEAMTRALDEDDPRLHFILVYDFLTWLQETLATALLRGIPEGGREPGAR